LSEISVICPVYNTEKYLPRCFDSVLQQTLADFEFVIVNDCSTDKSGDICGEYQKLDPRIKYIVHKKNRGIFGARNTGLDNAGCKLITWIDSDDWVDNDWLETLYNNQINYSADISIINSRNIYEKVKYKERKHAEQTFTFDNKEALRYLVESKYISNALTDKLIKKDLYKDLSFPKGRNCEDAALMHILVSRAKTIVYSNKKKYYYYYRLGSNMHRHSVKLEYDRFFMFKERLDFFQGNHYDDLLISQAKVAFNQGIYVLLMSLFYHPSTEESKYFSDTLFLMNQLSNSFEISKSKIKVFLLINGNFIQRFFIFFRYEFLKRVSYFIKRHFPFLLILYRKSKYSFAYS
jgi:glycosyltransferase involved in cell wall biosynthesis